MTRSRRVLGAVALCGLLAIGACARADRPVAPTEQVAPAGWHEVAGSPLGPREQALGLWTGHEVLLIGGSDAPPCPPTASCVTDPTPVTDGAALDPETGRWRPIAAPPVPALGAQGVVIGAAAYILPFTARPELLVYRVDRDTWTRLPTPFAPRAGYQLLAAGDRVVAFHTSDESAPGKDYLFDPATSAWTALPADPLGAAWDRGMAWTGRELMLFDHELIPNPGAEGPTLTRVAALNLGTHNWRRLPEAPMLATSPWIMAGGKLINPTLGGADGGKVGNWGRTYPYGGTLDPAGGAWSPLPNPPFGDASGPVDAPGGGAYTETTALYPGLAAMVLNIATGSWQAVPKLPGGDASGHTVVAAGVRMLVFGGARWTKGQSSGTLLNTTWIWTPER